MKIRKKSGTAILDGNVIDSLDGRSTTNAPSQRAVAEAIAGIGGVSGADYDSLPVGAIIDFEGDAIPLGYKEVGPSYEIIESGYTDEGYYYEKRADGRMEVTMTVEGSIDISKAWGNMYVSNDLRLPNYPVPFIERPTVVVSPQTQSGTQFILIGHGGSGNNSTENFPGYVALARPNSRTGVAYILDVIAKGKWK